MIHPEEIQSGSNILLPLMIKSSSPSAILKRAITLWSQSLESCSKERNEGDETPGLWTPGTADCL